MLRRWVIREHLISEHISGCTIRLSSNFAHNTSRGSCCALNFGLYEL